jgi:hypothetical protein
MAWDETFEIHYGRLLLILGFYRSWPLVQAVAVNSNRNGNLITLGVLLSPATNSFH